jgi:hypothetical protein
LSNFLLQLKLWSVKRIQSEKGEDKKDRKRHKEWQPSFYVCVKKKQKQKMILGIFKILAQAF